MPRANADGSTVSTATPLDRAVAQPAQDLQEAVDVHGLGQAVLDRLAHDRVLHRDLDRAAGQRLRAREHLGKGRGQQVVRPHPQQSGAGTFLPPRRPLEQQRALRVPAPARLEHRRGQQRLDEDLARRRRGGGSRRRPRAGSCAAGPSERTIASSFAAACSSKPKPTQKRLRSARPQARLIREPKGACTTSCMPPLSSKKRSRITRRCVGTAPRAWRPAST